MEFAKKYKFQIIIFLIFVLSLFFDGFTVLDFDKSKITYKSFELLFIGIIAFLGGGIFETFIWTANPLFLFSIILSRKFPVVSLVFSFLSSLISLSFLLWHEVLVAENGREAEIIQYHLGYWLWVLSIFLLFVYNIVNLILNYLKNKRNQNSL